MAVTLWMDSGHLMARFKTEKSNQTQRRRTLLSSAPSKRFKARWLLSGAAGRLQSGNWS